MMNIAKLETLNNNDSDNLDDENLTTVASYCGQCR